MTVVDRARGFTLVEALAGFTILALSMIVLMDGLAMAWRREAATQTREDLLRVALGELEEMGTRGPLVAGRASGAVDGVEWYMTTEPFKTLAPSSGIAPSAFWVEIVVAPASTASTMRVRLRTLKLQRGLEG